MGAVDYVTKPFQPEELAEKLARPPPAASRPAPAVSRWAPCSSPAVS